MAIPAKPRRSECMGALSGSFSGLEGSAGERGVIHHKLLGQEQVARDKLRDSAAADGIAGCRCALPAVGTMDAVPLLESRAASIYWGSWQDVQVTFSQEGSPPRPGHWRAFGTRKSILSGSPV